MTECERLIKEGKFSEDFLKEEVICDFKVDRNRKKLWMISLDMLLLFDSICKKHGLQYFLGAGTLLGSIRHKGFVPWDDDVDVFMMRPEYEKFLQIKKEEIEYPYFFQTPQSDPGYFYSFAKIRNSNTTSFIKEFAYQGFNQGIWFTVFPIDNWETKGEDERMTRIKELILDNSTYMRLTNPRLSDKDKERVRNYSGRNPMDVNNEIHSLASEFRDKKTEKVALAVCTAYPLHRMTFYAEDFASSVEGSFEGFKFPIPAGYDRILKTMYGDYTEFPPVDQRGKWHNFVVDPDIPYTEYTERYLKDNK